jgi:hypothetical protein
MKTLLSTISLTSILFGCGGGAGAPIQPIFTINSALAPRDLVLNCGTDRFMYVDPINAPPGYNTEYGYENNTWGSWGKYDIPASKQPWSQCIGAAFSAANTVVARWTWDFGENLGFNVKAYPEIVYGFKPALIPNTSPSFPKLIGSITSIPIKWDIELDKGSSAGNILLESWISTTNLPYSNKDVTVILEMGIIIDCWNDVALCNRQGEYVTIGGHAYTYVVSPPPLPGNPIAVWFFSVGSQIGKGGLDLGLFLTFLKSRGILSDKYYIDDIELGTELINGKGEVRLNSYSVTVH